MMEACAQQARSQKIPEIETVSGIHSDGTLHFSSQPGLPSSKPLAERRFSPSRYLVMGERMVK